MSIEEIEARRAARKASIKAARDEQYAKDIEQVDKLEVEHGDDRVSVLNMVSFVQGLPTLVVLRTPSASEYNRFRTQVRKANGKATLVGEAKDLLASSVRLYPDAETYERMREAWPSVHDNVGAEAIRLGEAEGKD